VYDELNSYPVYSLRTKPQRAALFEELHSLLERAGCANVNVLEFGDLPLDSVRMALVSRTRSAIRAVFKVSAANVTSGSLEHYYTVLRLFILVVHHHACVAQCCLMLSLPTISSAC
jgi:hypothetical protein